MDTGTIVISVIAILIGIAGLIAIKRMGKHESVTIKNVKYRKLNEPVGKIDYSVFRDGLGGDE